jgi:tetratricopeptide (TPR) repeat protein
MIAFVTNVSSQTDRAKQVQEASDLSAQVVKLYAEKKFDEAVPLAQKAVEIRKAILTPNDPAIATALINLGELYLVTKKDRDAEEMLKEALSIVESQGSPEQMTISRLLDNLAYLRIRKHDFPAAEPLLLRSLKIQEEQLGPTNARTIEAMKDYACLEIRNALPEPRKDKDETKLSDAEIEKRSIKMRADCWLYGFDQDCEKHSYVQRHETMKVLNGQAVRLMTPPYPIEARQKHLSGRVFVAVRIDELGNVSAAKSVCGGYAELNAVGVIAARSSKFTPTSVNGKLIYVNGIIIYNFVAQ